MTPAAVLAVLDQMDVEQVPMKLIGGVMESVGVALGEIEYNPALGERIRRVCGLLVEVCKDEQIITPPDVPRDWQGYPLPEGRQPGKVPCWEIDPSPYTKDGTLVTPDWRHFGDACRDLPDAVEGLKVGEERTFTVRVIEANPELLMGAEES